jgi:uncharacterized membrane protein
MRQPGLSPLSRRIFHVVLFEGLGAVIAGAGLAALSGEALTTTGPLALVSSVVAAAGNFLYNTGFEAWEARQKQRGRGLGRRILHALGLELFLAMLLVPLLAWWLRLGLVEALFYDLAVTLFFVAYTFLFNLAFDKVFGLPRSAR